MPLRRLEDLVLFAEVVEQSGFSAAARHLGMQRSKLSRRIVELEKRMGVRLLQRTTRHVTLTEAGERVYAHARALAREARNAFGVADELAEDPSGLLRVACSATFAACALMPVVAAFQAMHPRVRFAIVAADRYVDLVSDRADLAFRISSGPLEDSSLVMRSIGELPMVLAARPDVLARGARLEHPKDIAHAGLVGLTLHDREHGVEFHHEGGESFILHQVPRLVCNNMAAVQAAVAAGIGVAVLPGYLCRDAMARGELVNAFAAGSGWRPAHSFAHALMPSRQGLPHTTRVFLEFAIPRLEAILARSFSEDAPGA